MLSSSKVSLWGGLIGEFSSRKIPRFAQINCLTNILKDRQFQLSMFNSATLYFIYFFGGRRTFLPKEDLQIWLE